MFGSFMVTEGMPPFCLNDSELKVGEGMICKNTVRAYGFILLSKF